MNSFTPAIYKFFKKQSKITIWGIVLGMVLILGYLDYITGFKISFSFFYLIPIAIATWYPGKNNGYLTILLSISVWLITNWAAGQKYSNEVIRYWNASTRLILFVLIIWLLEEFKRSLYHERMLAQTDYLTGIPNGREFHFQANAEILRARRFNQPITLAYMDVDSFKQINDQFGHSEGDYILRTVAKSLQISNRRTDTVARLGGDEFAILLPNTDQGGAKSLMQKVQKRLSEQMERTRSKATLSIGVVTFASSPNTVDELLREADKLMYQVKAMGKNGINFSQA